MDIDTVAHITDFLQNTHACSALYQQSVQITHTYKDRTLFKGTVGIFKLQNHPKANVAYAWLNDELLGLVEPTVFFKSEKISSPSAAVTAHLRQSIQQLMHA